MCWVRKFVNISIQTEKSTPCGEYYRVRKLPSMCSQKDTDTKLIQYARQITLLTWTGPQPRDRKCFAHQSVPAAHCQHHPSQWHCNQHVSMNNLQPNQCNWHFNTHSKTKHFSILHLNSATKCRHNKACLNRTAFSCLIVILFTY